MTAMTNSLGNDNSFSKGLDTLSTEAANDQAMTCRMHIEDLSFFYSKNLPASLKNITMPIYNTLIGPSGCGKSTLLRTMNRIYDLYRTQYAEGDILLDDESILGSIDLNELRSKVGMVFQKPTPFPMSIYDNMTFG